METLQRGVGVEVCPAEPPLDLESVCVRDLEVCLGEEGEPPCGPVEGVCEDPGCV